MSREENKAVVQRIFTEVFNAANPAGIAEFCVPGPFLAGGLEGQIRSMLSFMPDLQITIEDMLAEGDLVAARVTIRGTNSGPMLGFPGFGKLEKPVPPTGKQIISTGMYFFRFKDGKLASLESESDQIGVLRQTGWSLKPPGDEA